MRLFAVETRRNGSGPRRMLPGVLPRPDAVGRSAPGVVPRLTLTESDGSSGSLSDGVDWSCSGNGHEGGAEESVGYVHVLE